MGDHRSRGRTIRPASREEERVALALARSAGGALLKVDTPRFMVRYQASIHLARTAVQAKPKRGG